MVQLTKPRRGYCCDSTEKLHVPTYTYKTTEKPQHPESFGDKLFVVGLRTASHVSLKLSVFKGYELAYFTSYTNDFTASPELRGNPVLRTKNSRQVLNYGGTQYSEPNVACKHREGGGGDGFVVGSNSCSPPS